MKILIIMKKMINNECFKRLLALVFGIIVGVLVLHLHITGEIIFSSEERILFAPVVIAYFTVLVFWPSKRDIALRKMEFLILILFLFGWGVYENLLAVDSDMTLFATYLEFAGALLVGFLTGNNLSSCRCNDEEEHDVSSEKNLLIMKECVQVLRDIEKELEILNKRR